MAPLASRRSISAPGTMAPVGSATTPVMGGVGGGVALEGFAAKRVEDESKTARARRRAIRNLQSKARLGHLPGRARAKRFTAAQSTRNRPANACSRPNQEGRDASGTESVIRITQPSKRVGVR